MIRQQIGKNSEMRKSKSKSKSKMDAKKGKDTNAKNIGVIKKEPIVKFPWKDNQEAKDDLDSQLLDWE